MPNIREYENDPGYYIYARPPDAGNITYGIDPAAYPVFTELGYEHTDKISWRHIHALKAADLIETGDSGSTDNTLENDSLQTDAQPIEADFDRFYELLQQRFTLSSDQEDAIASTLGIDLTTREANFNERIDSLLPELETTHILNAANSSNQSIDGLVADFYDTISEYELLITVEDHPRKVTDGTFVEHIVSQQSDGYHVEIRTPLELTAGVRSDGIQHISVLDKAIRDLLESDESTTAETSISFSRK